MGMFIGDQEITMAYLGDLPIGTTNQVDYVKSGLFNYWDAEYTDTVSTPPAINGTWTDLIQGTDATLLNPVYYETGSSPYYFYINEFNNNQIVLYESASLFQGQNPITWLSWIYVTGSSADYNQIMQLGGYAANSPSGSINIGTWPSASQQIIGINSGQYQEYFSTGSIVSNNQWYLVGFSWPNNSDYTLQGVNIFLNDQMDTPNTGSINITIPGDPNSNVTIGEFIVSTPDKLNGRVAISMIYDRLLTHDEVKQNFDYFKGRFGY